MNGQKERLMVLDMLAEGKISPEEAEQLFKAMEEVGDEEVATALHQQVHVHSNLSNLAAMAPVLPVAPVSTVSVVAPVNPRNVRMQDLVTALKDADIDHITMSDLQEIQTHNLTAE